MSGVFFASTTNSTVFTRCCKVAITDGEQRCPQCRQDVYPFFAGMNDAERSALADSWSNTAVRALRLAAARLERVA